MTLNTVTFAEQVSFDFRNICADKRLKLNAQINIQSLILPQSPLAPQMFFICRLLFLPFQRIPFKIRA